MVGVFKDSTEGVFSPIIFFLSVALYPILFHSNRSLWNTTCFNFSEEKVYKGEVSLNVSLCNETTKTNRLQTDAEMSSSYSANQVILIFIL